MILVEDTHYNETLDILRGKKNLPPVFSDLKDYIYDKYEACAHNFVFELIKYNNPQKRFRLYILLATTKDYRKMHSNNHLGYDEEIQNDISNKFSELANKYNFGENKSRNGVWVCYNDFSVEMKTDVNSKAIKETAAFIKKKYHQYNIWEIHSCFESSVVFFLTDKDTQENENIQTAIKKDYFEILKKHDEFDIFQFNDFSLRFDSKQNVDENYAGSLFYYFR